MPQFHQPALSFSVTGVPAMKKRSGRAGEVLHNMITGSRFAGFRPVIIIFLCYFCAWPSMPLRGIKLHVLHLIILLLILPAG